MGYYIQVTLENVRIKQENIEKALNAVNALHTNKALLEAGEKSWGKDVKFRDKYRYSWVNNPPEEGFSSLEEALDEWRYVSKIKNGNLLITEFRGEKRGDCDTLFKAIAPFIDGSLNPVIYFSGEDGYKWKLTFENGEFHSHFVEGSRDI